MEPVADTDWNPSDFELDLVPVVLLLLSGAFESIREGLSDSEGQTKLAQLRPEAHLDHRNTQIDGQKSSHVFEYLI